MANLIDTTYFIRDLTLPIDQVSAELTTYINTYEPELMTKILGYELYDNFLAALAGTPGTEWTNLRDGCEYDIGSITYKWRGFVNTNKESIIANYVWYQFVCNSDFYQSGFRKVNTDSSILVNPRPKQVKVYNQMVDWIYELEVFISNNLTSYANYLPEVSLNKINAFNI